MREPSSSAHVMDVTTECQVPRRQAGTAPLRSQGPTDGGGIAIPQNADEPGLRPALTRKLVELRGFDPHPRSRPLCEHHLDG